MSLKRSHAAGKSSGSGSAAGAKIDRQGLFDELKRLSGTGDGFSPVDVALSVGSSESVVAKALIALASAGLLERIEAGRYRASPIAEVGQAEFIKVLAQTTSADSSRQRDISEIGRLKQNNDIMRQRLLSAIAERDHYLSVLRAHGIEPGPVSAPQQPVTVDGPSQPAPVVDSGPSTS